MEQVYSSELLAQGELEQTMSEQAMPAAKVEEKEPA